MGFKGSRAVVDDQAAMDHSVVNSGQEVLPVSCVRSNAGLELESNPLAAPVDQQIDLGAGVRTKEVEAAAGTAQLFSSRAQRRVCLRGSISRQQR